MDSGRFDELTRALATDASRRSVLGTLLAAAGSLLFPRSGRAACISPGKACKQGDECCDGHTCFEAICDCPSGIFDGAGRCAPRGSVDEVCLLEGGPCVDNADCCIDDGLTCQDGTCLPAITVQVGCGQIGEACGNDLVCCGAPATTCSADGVCACTDPLILDRDGSTCVAVCSYPDEPCSEGAPCCDGAGTCVEGVCRCPDDLRPCGTACIDPNVRYRRDAKNCGARSNACQPNDICCEGICVPEASLATDPDRCGDCCMACHPWEVCCDGRCLTPFVDLVRDENVCCAAASICAPGDGTELCCAADEACHNGGCCRTGKECGETCCGDTETCHCGQCVVELESCNDDDECCGRRCVDGVCCPDQAICLAEDGAEFCCGIGHHCGDEAGVCAGDLPGRVTYPIRVPRP